MAEKGTGAGAREHLKSALWAMGMVWKEHTSLALSVVSVTIVRGLLPAVLALTARGLINTIAALLQDGAGSYQAVYAWLFLGFLAALGEALSLHVNALLLNRLRDRISLDLTTKVMEKASTMSVAFFENPKNRNVVARARQGAAGKAALFFQSAQEAVTQFFQTVSLVAVLVLVEPLVLVIVGPIAAPFLYLQWKLARSRFRLMQGRAEKKRTTDYYSTLLTGARETAEVKLLGIGRELVGRFVLIMGEIVNQDWKISLRSFKAFAGFSFFTVAAFYGVLLRVAVNAIRGGTTIGDLAIFGGAAVRLRVTLERTIVQTTSAMEQALFLSYLRNYLQSDEGGERVAAVAAEPVRGDVEFRNVTFTYPGSTNPVIVNLSLRIDEGETLALVGKNGAGKTTFVKLIAGLYRPDEGHVLVGGQDVWSLSAETRHRTVSMVMQNFLHYETTLRENIAFGDWERLRDRPDLVDTVAERSRLAPIIDSLPAGLDTVLGRSFGYHDLSGGQWQKVAIARGLARDSAILILDEPTASLDARSELDLYGQMAELAENRTTILISHRFSTINMADRIAVMKKGSIVELGSHDELVAAGGMYAGLFRLHRRWMTGQTEENGEEEPDSAG